MAKIMFRDFSIEVKESIEVLSTRMANEDFIEVTEIHPEYLNIPEAVVIINVNAIELIRE